MSNCNMGNGLEELLKKQKPPDPEAEKILEDNLWNLVGDDEPKKCWHQEFMETESGGTRTVCMFGNPENPPDCKYYECKRYKSKGR